MTELCEKLTITVILNHDKEPSSVAYGGSTDLHVLAAKALPGLFREVAFNRDILSGRLFLGKHGAIEVMWDYTGLYEEAGEGDN